VRSSLHRELWLRLRERRSLALRRAGKFADALDFYDCLLNSILVQFIPKMVGTQDKGFVLQLSKRMTYDQFSANIGDYLKVDPTHICFSVSHLATGTATIQPSDRTLAVILSPLFSRTPSKLYYEVLDISLSEFKTRSVTGTSKIGTRGFSTRVEVRLSPVM
jgi:ubiquitin carboxyl-terminal hydrolase 7